VKIATSLALALILACTGSALAFVPTTSNVADIDANQALKDAQVFGEPDPQPNVGGDTIADAVPIPAWPYTDSGNTCSFNHDYDEVCPYSGSLSPDVVYSLVPTADDAFNISLCTSLYDTKVYVYENVAGNLAGCNDDACGDDGFKSELKVFTTAGNTYYIVIDGYGSDCGEYILDIDKQIPCVKDCPPGGHLEGEPDCEPNYNDVFNGGCNSVPHVFSPIPCKYAATICGKYGGFLWNGLSYRDTDWYKYDAGLNQNGLIICCNGEYDTLFGYLAKDCGAPAFEEYLILEPCVEGCLAVPPGDWWIFVATLNFGPAAGACGGDYILTVEGLDCPIAVEPATWGEIKNEYR
jgi:hypothetical protein